MWKVGWFLQERSVKEREGVWWNMVVVTPDNSFVQKDCIEVDLVVWITT